MPLYKCKLCDKIFDKKSSYNYHINRKTPCVKLNTSQYKCSYCNSVFSRKDSLKRHLDKCQSNTDVILKTHICEYCNKLFSTKYSLNRHKENTCRTKRQLIEKDNNELLKTVIEMKTQINECNNKICNYEKALIENNVSIGTVNNITNNNIDNSQNTIIINHFGKENLNYLSDKDWIGLLDSGYMAPIRYAEKIHLNINHPENHNLLMTNIGGKYINVNENGRWEKRLATEVFNELLDNLDDIFVVKYDDLEEQLNEYSKKRAKKFMSLDRDDSPEEKEKYDVIINKLRMLFYNNKHIVLCRFKK